MTGSLLLLALMTGCKAAEDSKGSIENVDVLTMKEGAVTQKELYATLKKRYGEEALAQLTFEKILSKDNKVSKEEVNQALQEYKEQYGKQFNSILDKNGLTEEALKENLTYNLLLEKEMNKKLEIPDDVLKSFYETWEPESDIRQILVENEEKANQIKKQLDEGIPFIDLVSSESIDITSKDNEGFVKLTNSNQTEEIKTALKDLPNEGDISKPVKTSDGFIIIQLVHLGKKIDFETDKKTVKSDYIQANISPQEVQKLLQKIYQDAGIKISDKKLDAAFDTYKMK